MFAQVKVNNVPEYAFGYRFIVARLVDGELWFWGAWSDEDRAREAAQDIGGLVVVNQ